MQTFIFQVSGSSREARETCRRCLHAVRTTLPELGVALELNVVELEELGAAFGALSAPHHPGDQSRLQYRFSPYALTVAFGESPSDVPLIEAVCEQVERRGARAAATMHGNFSFIHVDRHSREIWFGGTALGHHALFFRATPPRLSLGLQDLVVRAAAAAPLEIDWVSVASSLACDWSLQGRSFARGIERCSPQLIAHWKGGALTLSRVPGVISEGRIDGSDTRATSRQVERVGEALCSSVRRRVRNLSVVRSSLTAGLDSRAVWAMLVRESGGRALIASTSGGTSSLDVQVARKLAHWVGAEHERSEPSPPTAAEFDATSRLMAFFCNGDTNAKRAMIGRPTLTRKAAPKAGGQGGEIFRGFFYPYFGPRGVVPNDIGLIASRLVRWRFRRLASLSFQDKRLGGAVSDRLIETLGLLAENSSDPYDILDQFYLLERYGCWGATSARLPWSAAWTPFEDLAAIRAAYALPSPVGKHCTVMPLLIRRFLVGGHGDPQKTDANPRGQAGLLLLS